jgi:hypothetical protein
MATSYDENRLAASRAKAGSLHQSGLGLHRYVDRAAAADVGKMRVEEAPRGALAELAQHFERLIIRGKRAGRFAHFFHQNAMQAQAAFNRRIRLRKR